jgi:hypothetical protein
VIYRKVVKKQMVEGYRIIWAQGWYWRSKSSSHDSLQPARRTIRLRQPAWPDYSSEYNDWTAAGYLDFYISNGTQSHPALAFNDQNRSEIKF